MTFGGGTMLAYVAHPIDNGNASRHVETVKHSLEARGFAIFDPQAGWEVTNRTPLDAKLQRVNHLIVSQMDLVVAVIPPNVTTIGVILEIGKARQTAIPVIAYTPGLAPSWALKSIGVAQCPSLSAFESALAQETKSLEARP